MSILRVCKAVRVLVQKGDIPIMIVLKGDTFLHVYNDGIKNNHVTEGKRDLTIIFPRKDEKFQSD
jgi:hypothetical protein